MKTALSIFLLLIVSGSATAVDLKVGTYNVESSSDTDSFQVAQIIGGIRDLDILTIEEVPDDDTAKQYTIAVPGRGTYRYILSQSGKTTSPDRYNDYLSIIYNSSKLRQLSTIELHSIRSLPDDSPLGKPDWHLRGALFAKFAAYDSGKQFYIGVVHLKCCNKPGVRAHQTKLLIEFIKTLDAPVILTGDFNIPVKPEDSTGNNSSPAFQNLTSVMTWSRPNNPIKTQCSPSYNSMLDHYFSRDINVESVEILEADSGYCDQDATGGSDHRPVVATFNFQ